VAHLKASTRERARHQAVVTNLKAQLVAAGVPVMPSQAHFVPVFVGDAHKVRRISDELLNGHGIYLQPINYPTVPRGSERLRITPTPLHTDEQVVALVEAMRCVFDAHGLLRGMTEVALHDG